ncbi:MAG: retroviral-like aspartic protease family protein [Treponema sp.]
MIAITKDVWEKIKPHLEQEEVFIDEVSSIFADTSSMETETSICNEISIDIDEKLPDLTTPIEIRNRDTTMKTWGLWDTGATKTGVAQRIASRLNLLPTERKEEISTASNTISVDRASLEIKIPSTNTYKHIEVNIIPNQPSPVVIGLDIICLGHFEIKRTEQGVHMTFKIEM